MPLNGRGHIKFSLTTPSFVDTTVERNAIMERVYPKLKQLCQENGYEFQVKDMCWGVRDAAVDDHVTTEVCLRELRACLKTSTGPSFVVRLRTLFLGLHASN